MKKQTIININGATIPSFLFMFLIGNDQVEILFNDGANLGQLYQSYKLDANSKVLISNAQHICKG